MDVGFLGLGRMGRGMVGRLVGAGHRVRVWNRSPEAARDLDGVEVVGSPAEAFSGDAALTMLADDAALRAVVLADGVLDGPARPKVHVGMSTVSVVLSRELAAAHAEAGVAYVAAPVFGRPEAAAAGALNVVAAGEAAAIAAVQPLLDAMGARTWRFGSEPHRANAVKLAGNFMLIAAIEAMSEAAAFAQGHDIEGAALLEMLTSTLFASPVYTGYGGLIAGRRYEPASFTLNLTAKDVRLALQAAEAAGVPMPIASVLRDSLIEAISHGDGDRDIAALARVAERRAGQG